MKHTILYKKKVKLHLRINRQPIHKTHRYAFIAHMEVKKKKIWKNVNSFMWIWCVQCIERMNAKKRTNERTNEWSTIRKKCAYNFWFTLIYIWLLAIAPANVLVSWKHAHCTYLCRCIISVAKFSFQQNSISYTFIFCHGFTAHGNIKLQQQQIKKNISKKKKRNNRIKENPIGCILRSIVCVFVVFPMFFFSSKSFRYICVYVYT